MTSNGNGTGGRVVGIVSPGSPGVNHLAAFLARRLGGRLSLRDCARPGPLAADPLGPGTRLAVVGMDSIAPEAVLETICISPCPVIVVPPAAGDLWARPSRALRVLDRVVVCGADGSREARIAAAFAARLADACAARLLVAHVRTAPAGRMPAWATDDSALALADLDGDADCLAAALREARKRVSPLEFTHLRGDVAGSLTDLAAEQSAMLIAIGSDGLDPGRLVMSGSHTAELLAEGTHPVAIVPPWTRLEEVADGARRGIAA